MVVCGHIHGACGVAVIHHFHLVPSRRRRHHKEPEGRAPLGHQYHPESVQSTHRESRDTERPKGQIPASLETRIISPCALAAPR
jgi:hypothetical protein